MCVGSCFRKLEDRRTVINLGFINYYSSFLWSVINSIWIGLLVRILKVCISLEAVNN